MHAESKRAHTHDVRCLAVAAAPGAEPLLISAGNDAQVLVHSVRRFTQARAPPERCPGILSLYAVARPSLAKSSSLAARRLAQTSLKS